MRSQPVLCRACGRDWRDETSQNGKSTLALGCLQGLDLRGHERNPIVKKNTANGICRSSRAKPKLAFICIGRCPMLWLFRPLQGLSFILLAAKVYAKPVLKIFALGACGMFFFCYRQIFIRRPFRSGKDCAFL